MKPTIITISGAIGSGKTSAANRVAEVLGYTRFSTGGYMRAMAAERGVSLLALLKQAETDPSINDEIDGELVAQGNKERLVIDSRLAFHFLPHTFKVYLTLPSEIAADRILADKRSNALRDVEHEETRDEILRAVRARAESERKQYYASYGVLLGEDNDFDLVLSTAEHDLESVVQHIVRAYQLWQNED